VEKQYYIFLCACVRVRTWVGGCECWCTGAASLAPPYFSTLSPKEHDFLKKKKKKKKSY
jgi:hypothetical protein